jgi:hypothetical protein
VGDEPENQTPRRPARTELSAAAAVIAGRCWPLKAGELQIDERGRIRPRDDRGPVRFGFTYRGVEYGAEVATGDGPRIRLTAELGKLPYSMEIGEGRRVIRRILDASESAPRGRIALCEGDDMRLEAVSVAPEPLTPASLMATLAALLFDLQPYLDLLGRVLDGARSSATNEASTGAPAGEPASEAGTA